MDSTRFDTITRTLATGLPRRTLLAKAGRLVAGATALGAGAGNVGLAEASRKRRRCRPKAGRHTISVETMTGPNRCTCDQSRQVLLAQISDQFCTGASDPVCPSKATCYLGHRCETMVVRDSAADGCTVGDPGDNPACPDTRGVVFDTHGAYTCTCGCKALI